MDQLHLDDATFRSVQKEMLADFAEDGYPPVDVSSADGLVSVKMTARFAVESVTLQGVSLEAKEAHHLQQALVATLNDAILEVTKRNAERLVQSLRRSGVTFETPQK